MPIRARRSAVLGPMPGRRLGGAPAKRSQAISRLSATRPAGFSASEAIFATSLLGPIPTEALSPVASWMAITRRRIRALGATLSERSR